MSLINRDTFLQLIHHVVITGKPAEHTLLNLPEVGNDERVAGAWDNHLTQIHTEHRAARHILDIEPGIPGPSARMRSEILESISKSPIGGESILHRNQFLIERVRLAKIPHSSHPRELATVLFFPCGTFFGILSQRTRSRNTSLDAGFTEEFCRKDRCVFLLSKPR